MLEVKYQEVHELENKLTKGNIYHFLKRCIDIIGALAGIIIMFIPCLIVSLLIKKDGGPIFFIQRRVGQDEKEFNMYKFRSMCMNAEKLLEKLKEKNEMDGPMFKIKDDPRMTKIGKFIRKTSIDELPQLLNILKGDMSVVGPRPSLPKEVAEFTDFQKLRLVAKPGLTCYWQVRGRNDVGFKEWMELDVQYCMDRTIILDIILIFKTFRVLFGDSSAS